MSRLFVLARPHNSADRFSCVIILTACCSPSEITGNPVSIASTPNSSNFFAMFSLFSGDRATPGDCSPSLNVVSKILILIFSYPVMQLLQFWQNLKYQKVSLILQMRLFDQV